MKQFVLENLTRSEHVDDHIIILVSVTEGEPEMAHAVHKSKLIWRASIVHIAFVTFDFLLFTDHCVADAQALDELV